MVGGLPPGGGDAEAQGPSDASSAGFRSGVIDCVVLRSAPGSQDQGSPRMSERPKEPLPKRQDPRPAAWVLCTGV